MLEQEPDAGLGNGGLGRLAACFLDSMATMQLPAMGYGLRYEYGIFRQTIQDGWQNEQPDNWLRRPDPWEVARPSEKVDVRLNCSFEVRAGTLHAIVGRPSSLIGLPFDRPVVGYGGKTINTLRLWAAAAPEFFDFQAFSGGEFVSALAGQLAAELRDAGPLSRRLHQHGTGTARFVQEYFLVACSLADLVRRFRRTNADWSALPDKVAIQLNDTHPALAVPELMRNPAGRGHSAGTRPGISRGRRSPTPITRSCPRRWRSWPLPWFEVHAAAPSGDHSRDQPARARRGPATRFPGDGGRVERVSLVEEGGERKIRMANLAIVGSHSTNGVAAIHSALLRTTTVKDLAELYPERFNNKTNGVTPRRWLLLAKPGAWRHHHQRHRRRLDRRPRSAPGALHRLPTTPASSTTSRKAERDEKAVRGVARRRRPG